MIGAAPVPRGCGTRKAGGIYAELGLAPPGSGGVPLHTFLLDPPRPVDHMPNVTAIGVTLIEKDDVTHIIDWIGAAHYPEVSDFIEEVSRFGLSRRLPENLDFSRLSPETRILCVHPKAWMSAETCAAIRPEGSTYDCPKAIGPHISGGEIVCLGACWESVSSGVGEDEASRHVTRTMPSFTYKAMLLPEGVKPAYRPAIFASFPLSRLAVVRAAEGAHGDALRKARKTQRMAVDEVDS